MEVEDFSDLFWRKTIGTGINNINSNKHIIIILLLWQAFVNKGRDKFGWQYSKIVLKVVLNYNIIVVFV